MRFLSYSTSEGTGVGVRRDDGYRGIPASAANFPGTLDSLVARGRGALAAAHALLRDAPVVDLSKATYLPPLARPPKILCIGLNYVDHAKEGNFEPPTYPTVFARFASCLTGHRQPIVRPALSAKLDYEAELVAILGKGGRNIPLERALDHVIGYSLFNDASIRDYQVRTPQWTIGKNFDSTGAFGPELVTADELPPGADGLRITSRLNGETVQNANTREMIFKVADLVSILSQTMTLEAGDMIVTGTPAGVGFARKPPLWMKPGDVCEIEIEGIGTLSNPIIAEQA
jgi:2-keto-4-pentenoate hydratase/2-oxohepta-3-ene-1,7-dioic acid hydratase in catechol pathway